MDLQLIYEDYRRLTKRYRPIKVYDMAFLSVVKGSSHGRTKDGGIISSLRRCDYMQMVKLAKLVQKNHIYAGCIETTRLIEQVVIGCV